MLVLKVLTCIDVAAVATGDRERSIDVPLNSHTIG